MRSEVVRGPGLLLYKNKQHKIHIMRESRNTYVKYQDENEKVSNISITSDRIIQK